jgi:hypothetical protein
MGFKKRQIMFVPEVNATSFVLFFEKGESGLSWSIRDYSEKGPPKPYGRSNFTWTADQVREKAKYSFDAPAVDTNENDFWHERTWEYNKRYLAEDSASIPIGSIVPNLSAEPRHNATAKSPTAQAEARHPKAFVSHSTQDRGFVEKFATDLRTKGIDVWFSGWEIKPGDSIRQKIDEGLGDCELFIVVLSKNSVSRPWVQTELDAATIGKLNGKVRKIIPIKIEECGDLPPMLGSLCWEDFSTGPYESALRRVHDSIFDIDVKPPLGYPQNATSGGERPKNGCPIVLSADWGIGEMNYKDKKELLQGYLETGTVDLRASNLFFHDDYRGEAKHLLVRYRWPGSIEVKIRTFAENDLITFS